jgi:hypothetical protein
VALHTNTMRSTYIARQLEIFDRRLSDAAIEIQYVATGVGVPFWALLHATLGDTNKSVSFIGTLQSTQPARTLLVSRNVRSDAPSSK